MPLQSLSEMKAFASKISKQAYLSRSRERITLLLISYILALMLQFVPLIGINRVIGENNHELSHSLKKNH